MSGDPTNTGNIVVLADDLSGAAELAGIAFAHGLSAEVQRGFEPTSGAHVIAIDTDSRHLSAAAAANRVNQVTRQVLATSPSWLFKKVDSVLRGNVRAELEAILQVTGQSRVLLIPANPSRGRIVQGGQYLIDGIPLDETHFALDPDHPRTSSDIMTLLGSEGKQPMHSVSADAPLPETSIIVPDVASNDDLFRRAIAADANTLLAGAADFFATLLHQRYPKQEQSGRESLSENIDSLATIPADKHSRSLSGQISAPALLVCGSRIAWPSRRQQCHAAGIPILPFSSNCAASSAGDFRQLLLGIAEPDPNLAKLLLPSLAGLARFVIQNSKPKTLLAEGGATAAAIAAEMKWTCFQVVATAPTGVGVLQPLAPSAPLFLIKPGSYRWPPEIWQAFLRCHQG